MIFETTEEELLQALDAIHPMSNICNKDRLGDRLMISTLNKDEVLLSLTANHEIAVQSKFKARVETLGSLELRFPLINDLLDPTRGQAGTYRFVADPKLGVVKIGFDIGSFSLTSYQVSDNHLAFQEITTSDKEKVATFRKENLEQAWNHVRQSLTEKISEDYPINGVAAFREVEGTLFLQGTNGNVLSQCPIETEEEPHEGMLYLVPRAFLSACSSMTEDNDEISLWAVPNDPDNDNDNEGEEERNVAPFSETLGNLVVTSEMTGLSLSTQTQDLAFYEFRNVLNSDPSEAILMLIPRDDFQYAVKAAKSMTSDNMDDYGFIQLTELGEEKSKIERTYPQLSKQNLAGVLTVGTKNSSYDLLIPTAKNFKECKKHLNIKSLYSLIENKTSNALIIQIPKDPNMPLVIGETDENKKKISALNVGSRPRGDEQE